MYEEIHLDSEWRCTPRSLRAERDDGQSARGEKRKQHDYREGIAGPFYQDRNEDEHQCHDFAHSLNAESEAPALSPFIILVTRSSISMLWRLRLLFFRHAKEICITNYD
jgi:hypothetical protein